MKNIKIGIFGAGRGIDLAKNFILLGCDIVALCDNRPDRLEKGMKELPSTTKSYNDFNDFIEQDMDAVVLANFFHEHTAYAIKCFERGIHVFSECISNGTMAEGVELVRAFEKSNSIYMLAENYPQMIFNREMKRVCDTGTLGKILYAEGEYNHPVSPYDVEYAKNYKYYEEHWRNHLPTTYYITHSLGPIMCATGATPKKVTAFSAFAPLDSECPNASYSGDRVSIITTLNDDGSIFRVTGCARFGGHHNAYRVCGTKGQIENLRGTETKMLLRYNAWEKPDFVEDAVSYYTPSWNDKDEELIKKSGHGGGDFLTAREFIKCIEENKQPEHPFDIYSATTMSSVAILAHRSVLSGGNSFDIPDFRLEDDRKKYENDRLSPFFSDGVVPSIPCCSHPDYKPTDEQIQKYFDMLNS